MTQATIEALLNVLDQACMEARQLRLAAESIVDRSERDYAFGQAAQAMARADRCQQEVTLARSRTHARR